MKPLFTLFIILLSCHLSLAQERTVSGTLTSNEDGSPLPGVNIQIKGTNKGTVTDANGYYSIEVPIGSVLVFSFIGMTSKEVMVTADNLQPVKNPSGRIRGQPKQNNVQLKPVPPSLFQGIPSKSQPGISYLDHSTPTYKSNGPPDPSKIRTIKRTGKHYVVRNDETTVQRSGFGLQFTTSFGVERISKYPGLQKQYAQGRPNGGSLQWQGADQKEIFSWGPAVKTLEYSNSSYAFDKNGPLVMAGSGNGKTAHRYDNLSFFKNGYSVVNELILTKPGPRNGTFIFDIENRSKSGVIPNSTYNKTNISINLKQFRFPGKATSNASLSFHRSSGRLLNRGANLTNIFGNVLRTPNTFDNSNGILVSGTKKIQAYQLEDGSMRSHAPGMTDNPYALAFELPDQEKLQRVLGTMNINYSEHPRFSFTINSSFDRQWNENIFGIPPGFSSYFDGRLTNKEEDQTYINNIITSAYDFPSSSGQFKVSLSYQNDYAKRNITRRDGFNFSENQFRHSSDADSLTTIDRGLLRHTHELIVNAQLEKGNWLNARLSNRNYFSNTLRKDKYTNFFPAISLSAKIAEALGLWSINDLSVYASLSRTLREASLVYEDWSYLSTDMSMANYHTFSESLELFSTTALYPETERKFESGIKLYGPRGLQVELSYHSNLTNDFIYPVQNDKGFELTNTATVKNYGAFVTVGYLGNFTNGGWGTELKWSTYKNIVTDLYAESEIPMAGFQSARSVLSEGKPLGAIFGTTYLRNESGQRIIGEAGFPLENPTLSMIGNPIPDWTLGWASFVNWKKWRCSFTFDYKKGGDIWNGTSAVLDYLGRSRNSGELRHITNYIFDGVDLNGNQNTRSVSFADPTQSLDQNRWTRYGMDGVGEEYIEDASCFRLSDLVLTYVTKRRWSPTIIREIRFSLIGRNLFFITPYSGADPATSLFGYLNSTGLDLFNIPSVRSYNAQITIKI